jgi:hypothetical protein
LCNWNHAPLGDKACHYEKSVFTTRWAQSTAGKPIVSYDDGKTWNEFSAPPNAEIPSEFVNVIWEKKTDP